MGISCCKATGRTRTRNFEDGLCRWSEHLPDDLIEMIVQRLSLIDSIRFSAVCTSWRRASTSWCQRATLFPWILKQVRSVDSSTAQCSLYSPVEDRVYNFKFPKATTDPSYSMVLLGSIDGYLIMSEHKSLKNRICYGKSINYFLNPITGGRIMLPPLLGDEPVMSVASSNPRCSECIVAARLPPRIHKLAFCRPGDKSWTYQSDPEWDISFYELQFHKDGKLYAFAEGRGGAATYLVVFDPVEVFSEDKSEMYRGKQFEIGGLIEGHRALHGLASDPPFFMISPKGELLLIWNQHVLGRDGYLQNPDAPFWVMKLNIGPQLSELIETTLEDQNIFINPAVSSVFRPGRDISIPSSKLTNSMRSVLNDKLGHGNCIYYARNTTADNFVICIYNLADRRIEYFSADNYIDEDNDAPELNKGLSWFTLVS